MFVNLLQVRFCCTHGLSGLESRQSSARQQQRNLGCDLSWIRTWLHCALRTTQCSVQKVQVGAKLGTICWLRKLYLAIPLATDVPQGWQHYNPTEYAGDVAAEEDERQQQRRMWQQARVEAGARHGMDSRLVHGEPFTERKSTFQVSGNTAMRSNSTADMVADLRA